jgi:hypothetical protein
MGRQGFERPARHWVRDRPYRNRISTISLNGGKATFTDALGEGGSARQFRTLLEETIMGDQPEAACRELFERSRTHCKMSLATLRRRSLAATGLCSIS